MSEKSKDSLRSLHQIVFVSHVADLGSACLAVAYARGTAVPTVGQLNGHLDLYGGHLEVSV